MPRRTLNLTLSGRAPSLARNDSGVALVLALLFVVLMTVIVAEYGYEARVEAALIGNRSTSLSAYLAAKSAVAEGEALLLTDLLDTNLEEPYDALTDVWAEGVPYAERNGALMQCAVDDEAGKLNLNALIDSRTGEQRIQHVQALRDLFINRGVEEDPVDAILDWLDADSEPGPYGAEDEFYGSLEIPYRCRNAPLESIEELLLIRGITPDVYFGDIDLGQLPLPELLTVRGKSDGRINFNTAEEELLVAVGMAYDNEGLADAVLTAREQTPFGSMADLETRGIVPKEQASSRRSSRNSRSSQQQQQQAVPTLRDIADVNGRVFRVSGFGLADECAVRIEAYVWRDTPQSEEPLRILDWRVLQ